MSIQLAQSFYECDAVTLARNLLGCLLVHNAPEGQTSGIIVETEAYRGPMDEAAHTYGGRKTKRTQVMFGPPGYAYIYRIYGMYDCLNVVAAEEGCPEAVLIRALHPHEGLPLMAHRRGLGQLTPGNELKLCSGPGKLTQAMGITRELNGADLQGNTLFISANRQYADTEVVATPRINIDYAGEWQNKLWRFLVVGSKHVSIPYSRPLS